MKITDPSSIAYNSYPKIPGKEDIVKKKVKEKRQNPELFQKGIKLRIYPNEQQILFLNQWIGAGRFVWNWALGKQKEQYQKSGTFLSETKLSGQLTKFREENDKEWLKSVPRTVLSQTLIHLKKSWKEFFNGIKGKRGDKTGQPVFRKKGGRRESATFQIDSRGYHPVNLLKNTLRLPGIGEIKAVFSEPVVGEISSITVYRKGSNWFASLTLINVTTEQLCRTGTLEGVPVPMKSGFSEEKWLKRTKKFKVFSNNLVEESKKNNRNGVFAFDADFDKGAVATSDGKTIYSLFSRKQKEKENRRLEVKKNLQRIFNRKMEINYAKIGIVKVEGKWPKGAGKKAKEVDIYESQNMKEIKTKIANIELQILNQKKDKIHRFTTEVILNHHTVVVESLDLVAMAQNKKYGTAFRRSFHRANLGELIRQLKYKAKWYGRNIIFVSQWFASSKQCSKCHQKNKNVKLEHQHWKCSQCGEVHERDENAAFNLWQEGWRLLQESLQQNSIEMLAAGSAVKGRSGDWMISQKKKTKQKRSLKPQVKPTTTPEFQTV